MPGVFCFCGGCVRGRGVGRRVGGGYVSGGLLALGCEKGEVEGRWSTW